MSFSLKLVSKLFQEFTQADSRRFTWRDFEADRSRCLEIDQELELGRALDGKIGGFGALKYPVDVNRGAAAYRHVVRSIRHQGARLECLARVSADRKPAGQRGLREKLPRLKGEWRTAGKLASELRRMVWPSPPSRCR